MAGDIYVYAASFLKNTPFAQNNKTKHTQKINLGYSITNKKGDSNLPQLNQLRGRLLSKKYHVYNSTPKLSQETIAEVEKMLKF